ncbi:MAG TPA: peptidylprolyl isomerase [Burkholderiales bacterium]|jgi:peptidyl-prolyl cis-trans isomerase C|nr:peptidylprolyl isomerase [Burkholderiales bacterium]
MKRHLLAVAAAAALALPAQAQDSAAKPAAAPESKTPAKAAAKPGAKPATTGPVATVNGTAIPRARLDYLVRQQAQRGAPDNEQTRAAVRDELINRELVAQEAARTGTAKKGDVPMQLEMARQEVLVGAYLNDYLRTHPVSDADVQKEYDRARAQTGATEYHARHILVESEEEAKRLIAELKKGAKFEELARKSSKDEGTRERGGDLDWSVPAAFDKAFADAMVKLQKGQITTEPVQSRFGFHVIQLEDQRAVNFPPLAQVKPQIQQRLTRQKVETLIRDLRAKAKVE